MFNSDANYITNVLAKFGIEANLEMANQVRHLSNDTRALSQGDIFCGINGTKKQGRDYIAQALAKNCHLVLVESQHQVEHGKQTTALSAEQKNVPVIEFYQLNQHLFDLAKAFYQQPQDKLSIIGITGTNGKTSTSQLIAKLLDNIGQPCSVIGTNGAGKVEQLTEINNTTPGATELHQWLHHFIEQKQQCVAMEVSSHALEQGRVTAELFDTAIFTNLSRDHLDYHETMDKYAQAKFQIFTHCQNQSAIINGDDEYAQQWLAKWDSKQPVMVYGRTEEVKSHQQYLFATNIVHGVSGVSFSLNTHQGTVNIASQLIGDFNIDNLLAAVAVLMSKGIALAEIARSVSTLTPVKGRMEAFAKENLPLAIVDYAHTPDALRNALAACRQHCRGDLWLVFGCGGDRDVGKRPMMGAIAEASCDHVIVTNDNPRTEKPEAIVQDILAGCEQPEKITVMLERQKAVLSALTKAKNKDVVLLAGKGHEDYIIVGEQTLPYDERELVRSTYAHGALS